MIDVKFLHLPNGFDASLIHQSQRERDQIPGSSLGVMKGPAWASLKQPVQHWSPAMRELSEELGFLVREPYVWWAWYVQMGDGSQIDLHDHRMALRSAIYYPRGQHVMAMGDINFKQGSDWIYLRSAPGMLIQFPSDLEHRVQLSQFRKEIRYSISFNLHPANQSGA